MTPNEEFDELAASIRELKALVESFNLRVAKLEQRFEQVKMLSTRVEQIVKSVQAETKSASSRRIGNNHPSVGNWTKHKYDS